MDGEINKETGRSKSANYASLAPDPSLEKKHLTLKPHLNALAARGMVSELEELLEEGVDVETKSPNGATPLVVAAKHGRVDIVKLLLKYGAKRTHAARDAAQEAHHTKIVELLEPLDEVTMTIEKKVNKTKGRKKLLNDVIQSKFRTKLDQIQNT